MMEEKTHEEKTQHHLSSQKIFVNGQCQSCPVLRLGSWSLWASCCLTGCLLTDGHHSQTVCLSNMQGAAVDVMPTTTDTKHANTEPV